MKKYFTIILLIVIAFLVFYFLYINKENNNVNQVEIKSGYSGATQNQVLTYSDVIDKGALTTEKESIYNGREIKWQGKIANYSQISGVKFCIVDEEHINPDIHSACEWFWVYPEEEYDARSDWDGNWVKAVFKNYSNVDYDKIISEQDTFLITGVIDGIDDGVDWLSRPVPNIKLTKIEAVEKEEDN